MARDTLNRMAIPKYSKLEFERKWLVPATYVELLEGSPHFLIEDLYLSCGRLRLRSMTDSETGEKTFKLCKKYGAISKNSEPIVNIYLTEYEYCGLGKLAGAVIKKKGYKRLFEEQKFSMDAFQGALRGLILCEIEANSEVALMKIVKPPIAIVEVTERAEFNGGNLCRLTSDEIRKLLELFAPEH